MTSQTQPSSQTSRPQGYLKEEFRFFHLKDLGKGPYEYHHHDFLKILILINGNVSYSIEAAPIASCPGIWCWWTGARSTVLNRILPVPMNA